MPTPPKTHIKISSMHRDRALCQFGIRTNLTDRMDEVTCLWCKRKSGRWKPIKEPKEPPKVVRPVWVR